MKSINKNLQTESDEINKKFNFAFFPIPKILRSIRKKMSRPALLLQDYLFERLTSNKWSKSFGVFFISELSKEIEASPNTTRNALKECEEQEVFLVWDCGTMGKLIFINDDANKKVYAKLKSGEITVKVTPNFSIAFSDKNSILPFKKVEKEIRFLKDTPPENCSTPLQNFAGYPSRILKGTPPENCSSDQTETIDFIGVTENDKEIYKKKYIKEINQSKKEENDLTDDFLKNKNEVKEESEPETITQTFTDQETNLLDDLKEEPFYFSEEEAEKLLKTYGFQKLEHFTRHVLCKHLEGQANNPPGLLKHELKKNEFTFIKSLEASPAPVQKPIENKNNNLLEYFRGKKVIAQAMQDYQKQEEITKFILKKHIYFKQTENPETEQELINLIGDLSEITTGNDLKNFLLNGLCGKLNENNLADFMALWNELIK